MNNLEDFTDIASFTNIYLEPSVGDAHPALQVFLFIDTKCKVG